MTDHKLEMIERRKRQRERTVGFTPVPNRAHQIRLATLVATCEAEQAVKLTDKGLSPKEVAELAPARGREQAQAIFRQSLPQAQIGVRVRPIVGTGKSYRNG